MDLPGYRLHLLRGDLAGFWSVSVSGNWRVVFRFDGADMCDVDLVDYHSKKKYADEEPAASGPVGPP
jgi:toxin HigB-1